MEIIGITSNLLNSSGDIDEHINNDSISNGINPANGLPMISDIYDIELNFYGTDSNHNDSQEISNDNHDDNW